MPEKSEEPKLTKQFILDHLDEDEVDLSMCNLPRVPVKELVRRGRQGTLYMSRGLVGKLPGNACRGRVVSRSPTLALRVRGSGYARLQGGCIMSGDCHQCSIYRNACSCFLIG